jgi:outer membrane receptor protein involved in Fe transport
VTRFGILLSASTALVSCPAFASETASTHEVHAEDAPAQPAVKAFTTGVAKGRDLLDSAISASTLDETDVQKIGSTSIIQTIGNMPGIRAESPGTDSYASITIRGLPLSADGSKFLQFQEDGLPVLEFADIHFANASMFIRDDLSLSQVQSIRGGSASTFSSNSPGGIINFISKTGEQEGGAIQYSTGLGYNLNRADFDYGAKVDDKLRFNVGGFYHRGEGPRATGYSDAFKGGQIKANITREFASGYVRLYLKYMDDREPTYGLYPVGVSGTDTNPVYAPLAGFDLRRDTLLSKNIVTDTYLDQNNAIKINNLHDGMRSVVKSVGLEGQVDVAGWTITDKFRFADISGQYNEIVPLFALPANVMAFVLGGPGATLRYASGPNSGQIITNPAALNSNGLLQRGLSISAKLNNLNNITNDFRMSRAWSVGHGKLTTTAGWYFSSQNVDMYWNFNSPVTDVAGGGNTSLIDIYTASGTKISQDGLIAYGIGLPIPTDYHRRYDVNYRINAPYGSLNYQIGKLAIGGSLRYDMGNVFGRLFGGDLGGGRVGFTAVDLNKDGIISGPESSVATLPLTQPGPVQYGYHYLSYSVGANYRIAADLSAFARYSRGARAGADRLLYPPTLNATGQLTDPSTAYGNVKQAEIGAKFRRPGMTLFVTGFLASTNDQNYQIGADASGQPIVLQVNRSYSAKGIELEGLFQHGPYGLMLNATYTKARIGSDNNNPALNGTTPRHAASLFFNAMPKVEMRHFTLGANINGTTGSIAQDGANLKQPGYVIVSPFLEVRPVRNVQLALNAYNVFDKLALIQVGSSAIPASGVITAQSLNGRTVTASVRYSF